MLQRTILIVDDVEDWRDQLTSILKRNGYQVDVARNYQEALKKVKHNPPELVIVDLRLDPVDEDNRDGVQLLEMLASLRINALVLTGYSDSTLKQKAETLDVIGVLEKSFIAQSLSTLKEVINEIFREIETRTQYRIEATKKFYRGEVVGFPEQAAGYPLRNALQDAIKRALKSKP